MRALPDRSHPETRGAATAAAPGLQRQRPAQRLVEVRLLAHGERAPRRSRQDPEPGLEELDIERGRIGASSGLKPVDSPFFSGQYSPPSARTRISRPRSLSKMTWVAPWRESSATRNPMKTVLPEPVGPQMSVWPVSLRDPPSGSFGSLA